ncbi:hypothetical protein CMQ_7365 [Grosmannia clavigera kw1407]|uniref:Uncharacterized protein n=1 Tax=Grosmannia clavigera (strain kw1407 / UAMH 11150) TaxID=655863 RepID=F0XPK5_GROCL|nr:uncharacterized protein CMQ_7365 [Grosmannia clavigera kw1407]EFX00363.1 hypothetical protein CMQ_7365 [Grosmannia clavigera kw1407]
MAGMTTRSVGEPATAPRRYAVPPWHIHSGAGRSGPVVKRKIWSARTPRLEVFLAGAGAGPSTWVGTVRQDEQGDLQVTAATAQQKHRDDATGAPWWDIPNPVPAYPNTAGGHGRQPNAVATGASRIRPAT